ncbi:hypothetical protein CJU89_5127 [Yarrowia sp. B02]|nr:hypothetical protein CJU89_5127 [Yarrowia sp. B02]
MSSLSRVSQKIRTGTKGDFRLVSSEGESIEVHTAVLVPLWPFFEAAAAANMKETADKALEIQCPTSTLEVIVRFFYEQDLEMGFEEAENLIVVAQMYGVSELYDLAVSTVKNHDMSVGEPDGLAKEPGGEKRRSEEVLCFENASYGA